VVDAFGQRGRLQVSGDRVIAVVIRIFDATESVMAHSSYRCDVEGADF